MEGRYQNAPGGDKVLAASPVTYHSLAAAFRARFHSLDGYLRDYADIQHHLAQLEYAEMLLQKEHHTVTSRELNSVLSILRGIEDWAENGSVPGKQLSTEPLQQIPLFVSEEDRLIALERIYEARNLLRTLRESEIPFRMRKQYEVGEQLLLPKLRVQHDWLERLRPLVTVRPKEWRDQQIWLLNISRVLSQAPYSRPPMALLELRERVRKARIMADNLAVALGILQLRDSLQGYSSRRLKVLAGVLDMAAGLLILPPKDVFDRYVGLEQSIAIRSANPKTTDRYAYIELKKALNDAENSYLKDDRRGAASRLTDAVVRQGYVVEDEMRRNETSLKIGKIIAGSLARAWSQQTLAIASRRPLRSSGRTKHRPVQLLLPGAKAGLEPAADIEEMYSQKFFDVTSDLQKDLEHLWANKKAASPSILSKFILMLCLTAASLFPRVYSWEMPSELHQEKKLLQQAA